MTAHPSAGPRDQVAPLSLVAGDDLPEIVVGHDDAEVLDAAERALLDDEPGRWIYQRSGALVRVIESASSAARLVRTLAERGPIIDSAPAPWIRERLSTVAIWMRPGRGSGAPRIVRVDVPERLATQLLARGSWEHFPRLLGIVEEPTIRPDGSLLELPGYDAGSGLLLVRAADAEFAPIPSSPSIDDARRALATLDPMLAGFPWVAACDRAAAIAALLTLVGRFAVPGPAPMFFARATCAGTGKTLLVRILGIVASGRRPALRFSTRDPAETRKALFSLGLAGARLIGVDNVVGVFGDEVWAGALTMGEVSDRILGENDAASTPTASLACATFFGTGNNVSFRADCGRRVVPIDMDAGVEIPEERRFAIDDLEGWVFARRPELLAASLTILRAFFTAGAPRHGGPRMGSFERWDDVIRSACIWVGLADPWEGRKRIRDEGDSDLEALRGLTHEWARVFGPQPVQLSQVVKESESDPALRAAIEALADVGPRKPLTARTLSYAVRGVAGRPVNGAKLVNTGDTHGAARWALCDTTTGGDGRDGGDGSSPPGSELTP